MNGKKWKQDELIVLKRLYEDDGLCCSEISKIMKRPYFGIRNQIEKQNLIHTKEQEFNVRSRIRIGDKNPMFGKSSPNKGLTKENSSRILEASIKLSNTKKQLYNDGKIEKLYADKNPMFGKKSWNSGLSKETDERILSNSIKNSITQKEKWNNLSEEEKEKRRIRWGNQVIKALKRKRGKTTIECKIEKLLNELDIDFQYNYPINKFVVDFYLKKYNIVVECLGDYWHANPLFYKHKILDKIQLKNIDRDNRKIDYLNNNNIRYLFFWENDINKNIKNIQERILNEIR